MGITIDKKLAEQFQGEWSETPLAKYVAEPFWKRQDSFVITEEGLKEVIKKSGGYRCHDVTKRFKLCLPDELDQKAEKIAHDIYQSIVNLAANGSIDTPDEAKKLKDLLNSGNLFLKEGGIEVIKTPSFSALQFAINGYCANPDPKQVYDKFKNVHQFYGTLKKFFEAYKKKTARLTTINIGYFQPSGQTDRLYLTLYGGLLGFFRHAMVVRLIYAEQDGKQKISWEIIHKPKTKASGESELEYAVRSSSADPKLKDVFLGDEHSIQAKGTVTIDTSTGLATSEVSSTGEYRDKFYTIASGILNFLLYACGDPRIHTGVPVNATIREKGSDKKTTDFTIIVKLPGLHS